MTMTYADLKACLTDTGLFKDYEVHAIVRTCGKFTVGNAIIAAGMLGYELTGNDIDVIIHTTYDCC